MVVDTDIIVRYLVADDEAKAQKFANFLSSEKRVHLTDLSFAEIYWVMVSFYKIPKKQVLENLYSLIYQPSIDCNEKLLTRVIDIAKEHNISFIDAYNAAFAVSYNTSEVMSYDKGFNKIDGVVRREP